MFFFTTNSSLTSQSYGWNICLKSALTHYSQCTEDIILQKNISIKEEFELWDIFTASWALTAVKSNSRCMYSIGHNKLLPARIHISGHLLHGYSVKKKGGGVTSVYFHIVFITIISRILVFLIFSRLAAQITATSIGIRMSNHDRIPSILTLSLFTQCDH